MAATPGRIVLYTLSADDVAAINRRRADARASSIAGTHSGAQVHVGNEVRAGDVVPLLVVRAWPNGEVNGQAFLDGNDTLWVCSAAEGEGPRTWAWPPRV